MDDSDDRETSKKFKKRKEGNKKKVNENKKILYTMEDSEDEESSEYEENKIIFMGIETQDDELDVEGEVDLKDELISAIEELRKSIMKNEESNQIIVNLKTQHQEAKNIEEELELQLKKIIQDSSLLEEKITLLRIKHDE